MNLKPFPDTLHLYLRYHDTGIHVDTNNKQHVWSINCYTGVH